MTRGEFMEFKAFVFDSLTSLSIVRPSSPSPYISPSLPPPKSAPLNITVSVASVRDLHPSLMHKLHPFYCTLRAEVAGKVAWVWKAKRLTKSEAIFERDETTEVHLTEEEREGGTLRLTLGKEGKYGGFEVVCTYEIELREVGRLEGGFSSVMVEGRGRGGAGYMRIKAKLGKRGGGRSRGGGSEER